MVLSMFSGITGPLTEEEYRLLGLPKYRIFKRKKFLNIYKTLLVHLIKLSIPKAFPERSNEILTTFNELYEVAYKSDQSLKKDIDNDLRKFGELTDFDVNEKFQKLSSYIVNQFEESPRKYVFIAALNNHINDLYDSFIDIGKQTQIIDNPDEV
jgi:hypothetical protein